MGSNNFSNSWASYVNIKLLILVLLPSFLLVSACSDMSSPADVSEEITPSAMNNERAKKGLPEGVVYNEFNRNYYMPVATTELTWDEANEAASSMPAIKGCQPHLATITSANEQGWIASTFPEAITDGYWLGGKQAPGTADPIADWGWITGETWLYTNWNIGTDEPNDFDGQEEESLQFLLEGFGGVDGGWNDQAFDNLGGVGGYLVEWDCKLIVTGGGQFFNRQFSFNAQKSTNTSVKGQAQSIIFGDDGNQQLHMAVTCVSVWGEDAWVGAVTTKSTISGIPEGTEFLWRSQDDSGNPDTSPDRNTRFIFFPNGDIAQNCAVQPSGGLYDNLEEYSGNLMIH